MLLSTFEFLLFIYFEASDVLRTITKNFDLNVFDDHFFLAKASSCGLEFDVGNKVG